MKLIQFSVVCILIAQHTFAAESPCGAWKPFKDEKCILVIDEFLSFEDAVKSCRHFGTDSILLSIHSAEEQSFVNNYLFKTKKITETIWIGAKFIGNKKFRWADNTEVDITNWGPESPKNNVEHACVQMISEGANLGKWADEPCTKRNLVVCQKPQSWSIHKLQQTLLETRKNLTDSLEAEKRRFSDAEQKLVESLETEKKQLAAAKLDFQNSIENERKKLQVSIEDGKRQLFAVKAELQNSILSEKQNYQNLINNLKNNPVPVGFIYVQLPNQPDPKSLWPMVKWADVTGQYAGLFFRAEGNGAAPFGQIQSENAPRLAEIQTTWGPIGNFAGHLLLQTGQWSGNFYSGNAGTDDKDAFKMRISGGEVRPRNMAMKVWKRT